jgi:hypothetical protein
MERVSKAVEEVMGKEVSPGDTVAVVECADAAIASAAGYYGMVLVDHGGKTPAEALEIIVERVRKIVSFAVDAGAFSKPPDGGAS